MKVVINLQIIPIIPTEAHDQSVDYIITEKQIIKFFKIRSLTGNSNHLFQYQQLVLSVISTISAR